MWYSTGFKPENRLSYSADGGYVLVVAWIEDLKFRVAIATYCEGLVTLATDTTDKRAKKPKPRPLTDFDYWATLPW